MNSNSENVSRKSGRWAISSARNGGKDLPGWPVCFALLALVAFAGIASAQSRAMPRAASVLQPQAYVSLQPVPRGKTFEVAMVAKITPGFHVNAHIPSEEYLIPTNVTAKLPAGIVLLNTAYPPGVMRTLHFSKTALRVYDGTFTVRMKLRVAGAAPIGTKKIALTIAYQACNEDACLPPTTLPATAELEIAAAGTPAHPANANIFTPARP